jgi:hypothetical protein
VIAPGDQQRRRRIRRKYFRQPQRSIHNPGT